MHIITDGVCNNIEIKVPREVIRICYCLAGFFDSGSMSPRATCVKVIYLQVIPYPIDHKMVPIKKYYELGADTVLVNCPV